MTSLYVQTGYVADAYVQTGITIIWGQRIIFIPRSETVLVQSVPSEIRSLSIDTLRLALKDLEDSELGMNFPATHSHNAEVSLAGIVLARVVELINDYTITFEDGQYAVNLTGANSNIADKVNVNFVSVRASNSAGLVNPDIGKAVWEHATATTILTKLDFIKGIEGGRWRIVANEMIFYAEDNITELARFGLKDANGNATMINPMERVRL